MSAILLNYPKRPQQLSDDLESFVHLINWLTLRFHIPCQRIEELSGHLYLTYEISTPSEDGYDIGSITKLKNMRKGDPGFLLGVVQSQILQQLVEDLAEMCKEHYSSLDLEKDLKPFACKERIPEVRSAPNIDRPSLPRFFDPKPTPPPHHRIHNPRKPLLDNHDRILELFVNALSVPNDVWKGESEDRLEDQFARLSRKALGTLTQSGSATKQRSGAMGVNESTEPTNKRIKHASREMLKSVPEGTDVATGS